MKRERWALKYVSGPRHGWYHCELSEEARVAVDRIGKREGIHRDRVVQILLEAELRGVAPSFQ